MVSMYDRLARLVHMGGIASIAMDLGTSSGIASVWSRGFRFWLWSHEGGRTWSGAHAFRGRAHVWLFWPSCIEIEWQVHCDQYSAIPDERTARFTSRSSTLASMESFMGSCGIVTPSAASSRSGLSPSTWTCRPRTPIRTEFGCDSSPFACPATPHMQDPNSASVCRAT